MYSIDASNLVDQIAQVISWLLVTIPQRFISSTLDSGIARTIWVTFFGNAQVIQAFFVIALVGGFYLYFSDPSNLRGSGSGGRM